MLQRSNYLAAWQRSSLRRFKDGNNHLPIGPGRPPLRGLFTRFERPFGLTPIWNNAEFFSHSSIFGNRSMVNRSLIILTHWAEKYTAKRYASHLTGGEGLYVLMTINSITRILTPSWRIKLDSTWKVWKSTCGLYPTNILSSISYNIQDTLFFSHVYLKTLVRPQLQTLYDEACYWGNKSRTLADKK